MSGWLAAAPIPSRPWKEQGPEEQGSGDRVEPLGHRLRGVGQERPPVKRGRARLAGVGVPRAAPLLALLAAACSLEPSGERPGLWLSGELVREPVPDWSFTDAIPEIAIETRTRYGVPHSVTIWCVAIDGELYVGASFPEFPKERRWVSNVRRDPRVRLKIAGRLYERRLERVLEPEASDRVNRTFGRKYDYDVDEDPDPVAYWRVVEGGDGQVDLRARGSLALGLR